MISNHIDMVPVLDGDDLVGVITTTDLIKLYLKFEEAINELCPTPNQDSYPVEATYESSFDEAEFLNAWINREVREIMTEQVISLNSQDDIAKAMQIMQDNKFRHIPIVDEDDKCVGLISDRDILRNLPFASKQPTVSSQKFRENLFSSSFWSANLLMPIESIMARNISHISADCRICEAAYILLKKRISCLPVIEDNEKLLGILTIVDMIRSLLGVYEPSRKIGLIPSENRIC
jgi:CBS domain-containing protein